MLLGKDLSAGLDEGSLPASGLNSLMITPLDLLCTPLKGRRKIDHLRSIRSTIFLQLPDLTYLNSVTP